MPITASLLSGDGVTATFLDIDVQLPDSGTTITVAGIVQTVGGTKQTVAGTVVWPGAPGSGSNFYMIEVNTTSGTATLKNSTSATPAPDASNIQVFSQTVASGAGTNPWAAAGYAVGPPTW